MPQKKVCIEDYVIRIKCTETKIPKKPCPKFHRFNRETKAPTVTLDCPQIDPNCECTNKPTKTNKCSNCPCCKYSQA